MKPAPVLTLTASLILLVACQSLGQGRKAATLSRDTALSILNEALDNSKPKEDQQFSANPLMAMNQRMQHAFGPQVLHKNLYLQLRAFAMPNEVPYRQFLNNLVEGRFLQFSATAPIYDGTMASVFRVIPQSGIEAVQVPFDGVDLSGNTQRWCCPVLRVRFAAQKFLRVTGIRQSGSRAVADVVADQEPTKESERLFNAQMNIAQSEFLPLLQSHLVSCTDCAGIPLRRQYPMRFSFTKYDDGWRLGN